MTYFGFEDLFEKLVVNGIHNLENVVTLHTVLAYFFKTLAIWFEVVVSGPGMFTPRTDGLQDDQDNTYAIRAREDAILRSYKNPITLTSQHPDLPLPNQTFLTIHAACRIAHLSGARQYIDKTLYDMVEIETLESDL